MSKALFVFSMRLHALIFASRVAVPTVGIVYDPKMDVYLKMLGMKSAGAADSIDIKDAQEAIEWAVLNHDDLVTALKARSSELEKAAEENEYQIIKLLEG